MSAELWCTMLGSSIYNKDWPFPPSPLELTDILCALIARI